nr:helix-turn-helix domain-containing protein [Desulforamulus aquiferis]
MENLIQGLVVTQEKELLGISDLPNYLMGNQDTNLDKVLMPTSVNVGEQTLNEIMADVEKDLLKRALDIHGSVPSVAKVFHMDRSTIFRKMKRYNLI